MRRFLLSLLAFVMGGAMALQAEIVTREVSYPAGEVTAKGFFAAPGGGGKHPGVLVVHEFWGLNDYARTRVKMLAELGYAALAVDMYGDGKVATHPDDAKGFTAAVMSNMAEAQKRFEGAMKFLQAQPEVNPDKIAAIGYCFGGGIVLQMACDGVAGLDAVASFHGSMNATIPAGVKPTARMLVCHGGDDKFATPEAIADFQARMKAAGIDLTFITYPGALHGFTNPDADRVAKDFNLPVAYNEKADKESWSELQKFLKASFAE